MNNQILLNGHDQYRRLEQIMLKAKADSILLVCDKAIKLLKLDRYFSDIAAALEVDIIRFQDFTANPVIESVLNGVTVLNKHNCRMIIAVGGGSAIDVAKCIKLQSGKSSCIPLTAIPTTAGSGSEATRYAVIYDQGIKQSICDEQCLPDYILLDPALLDTLPVYQKQAAMMDALCHAAEAWWSVNSTSESMSCSKTAMSLIIGNMDGYLKNTSEGCRLMQEAAYHAGRAINLAQTTAAHAMSYKLTSLYGIAHGHAAALCLPYIWNYMVKYPENCVDPRGTGHLHQVFRQLAAQMNCQSSEEAISYIKQLTKKMGLTSPRLSNCHDLTILTQSVNSDRLNNHPAAMDNDALLGLYKEILKYGGDGHER